MRRSYRAAKVWRTGEGRITPEVASNRLANLKRTRLCYLSLASALRKLGPRIRQVFSVYYTKAQRSPQAKRKDRTKRSADGLPIQSFRGLLKNLSTIARNRIQPTIEGAVPFDKMTMPSPVQQRAWISWAYASNDYY